MLGLRPFTSAILITALVSFYLLAFVFTFLNTSNPSSDILNSTYNVAGYEIQINQSINDFSNRVYGNNDSIFASLGSANPKPVTFLFLIFVAAFDIPKAFLQITFSSISVMFQIMTTGFGGGAFGAIMATGVVVATAILLSALVFAIISAIRTGSSER